MPDPVILDEHLATAHGTVRYARVGSGPPLVLVHGTRASSHAWHRLIPTLRCHRTVHVYDLLGYGQSEKGVPDAGHFVQIDAPEAVLARVLPFLGIEPEARAGDDP